MAIATLTPLVRYLHSIGPAESDAALLARFSRHADESAFAELVRRHGPIVFGVCQRVLRDRHAAEDAFQVTFLLLARKAGALRQPGLLSNWLHGVAFRTACKLRGRLWRRQLREQPFDETMFVPTPAESDDCVPDLDAAIQHLPSKYRVPLVLCYFEGLTNAEAAARLGCPQNTVATRLARARQRLRSRLTQQGLTVAVSAAVVAAAARNATALMTGAPLAADILTLMEGVQKAMMWNKVKIAIATVALLAAVGAGAGRVAFRADAQEPSETGQPTPASRSTESPPLTQAPAAAPASPPATERIPALDVTAPQHRSKNFVVTAGNAALSAADCERIAAAAEQHRKDLAKLWLLRELPDWTNLCPIRATITTDGASSATTFQFGKAFGVMGMRVLGTREQILDELLPHEVMHTILADHFRQQVPRWADEGVAVMCEDAPNRDRHELLTVKLLNDGRALRLARLFVLKDYPADVLTVYAQGYSVTRFLVERADRRTFLEFVRTGMNDGWDAAAKRWYNIGSVNDLEKAWLDWMRKEHAKAPAPQPPRSDGETKAQIPPPSPVADDPPRSRQLTTVPPLPQAPPAVAPVSDPIAIGPDTPPPAVDTPLPSPQSPAINELVRNAPLPLTPPAPFADGPVPSQPVAPVAAPPTPIAVTASKDKDGMIVIKFPKVTTYQQDPSYEPGTPNANPVMSYVKTSTQEERSFRPDLLTITGTDGKPVLIVKECSALFIDGGTVDPNLLPLLKPETLIISVKRPSRPAVAVPIAPSGYSSN